MYLPRNVRHCLLEHDRKGVMVLFRFIFMYILCRNNVYAQTCCVKVCVSPCFIYMHHTHRNVNTHTVFLSQFKINIKGYNACTRFLIILTVSNPISVHGRLNMYTSPLSISFHLIFFLQLDHFPRILFVTYSTVKHYNNMGVCMTCSPEEYHRLPDDYINNK